MSMGIDGLDGDELSELAVLYVLLNKGGWPLTEENADDFVEACQILLISALVRGGVDIETAIHQITGRDGKLKVVVENGELNVSMEYDEHTENAIAVTITEGER